MAGKHELKKKPSRLKIIIPLCILAAVLLALVLWSPWNKEEPDTPDISEPPVVDDKPEQEIEKPEDTPEPENKPEQEPPEESEPEKEPEPEPVPEPQPEVFTLSFAGDCTLGTEFATYGSWGSFVAVVGDNYAYPLEFAAEYFKNDDFTFVNLESVLTEYNVPAEKTYRFRGPPEYVNILTKGGVEMVNLANNHTRDYGETGYNDTKEALEGAGVSYVESRGTALYTLEGGVTLGFYALNFPHENVKQSVVNDLREKGADIVICSYHWGVEGDYKPNANQQNIAHAAIDAGVDIVVGTHPHVLQPIEYYGDGVIYYSLGNFSFGGNRNPADKDSVIIRQEVIREVDGTVHLGEMTAVPFRLSGVTGGNDYRPVPMEEGSDEYLRTLSKLDGSFVPPVKPAPAPVEPETPPEVTPEVPGEVTPEIPEEIPETPETPEIPESPSEAPDAPAEEESPEI